MTLIALAIVDSNTIGDDMVIDDIYLCNWCAVARVEVVDRHGQRIGYSSTVELRLATLTKHCCLNVGLAIDIREYTLKEWRDEVEFHTSHISTCIVAATCWLIVTPNCRIRTFGVADDDSCSVFLEIPVRRKQLLGNCDTVHIETIQIDMRLDLGCVERRLNHSVAIRATHKVVSHAACDGR